MAQSSRPRNANHDSRPSRQEARIADPRLYKKILVAAFLAFAVWEGVKHLTLMAVPMIVQHGLSAIIEVGLALVILVLAVRGLAAQQRELDRTREVRDSLASALANDLRQPLLRVIESLEELQRAPETTDGTRQLVEHAMQGARPLVGMAIELLRVTPPEEGEKVLQRFNCSDLLRSARDTVQVVAAARRVEISADIPGSLGPVQALPHSLVSAMVILLDNAVGATPNGGQVYLNHRHRACDER
jgi:signal transduction histidine kinase